MPKDKFCLYKDGKRNKCSNIVTKNSLCFWHHPNIVKTGPDIKQKLEKVLTKTSNLNGYQLEGANLNSIDFVSPSNGKGCDLSNANLKRASLENAHLYKTDFSNTILLKTNLTNANLNNVNFEGANLLGANLQNASIEHIKWGQKLFQENFLNRSRKTINKKQHNQKNEEIEETCRSLRQLCISHGLNRQASDFFYKEMCFKRLSMPLFSKKRALSWLINLICGYGERPFRVIIFSILFIFLCATGFFFLGIEDEGVIIGYTNYKQAITLLYDYFECIYFSVVTFTTLGYGDIVPIGVSRLLATVESFIGSFFIALYVVVFVRSMSH